MLGADGNTPAGWPRVWMSYRRVDTMDHDFADMRAHGVGAVAIDAGSAQQARDLLAAARRHGLKLLISTGDITENAAGIRAQGLEPVDALLIGGVYGGKAIDRHLFSFAARPQEITVEPPVYSAGFAYTSGSRATGASAAGEPIGHYYPDMGDPIRAEVVVPLRRFDGRQHLRVVPATVERAPAGAALTGDSVTAAMPPSPETRERRLYRVRFDLTGLDRALLDQVGIAVYWPYHGTSQYWIFGHGDASAAAESTRAALRRAVAKTVGIWTEANGGTFPSDTVLALRFGDECFYITGRVGANDAPSYPLWDYSAPQVAAFRAEAGRIEYPRTWGFPEVYGPAAYGWWMYALHESCAQLAGIVHEEARRLAPGLLVFRNTTRNGVFDLSNDHDGSGPELLTRQLDLVHLDPYPVSGSGYGANIPRDMSYYAGLARRYGRLLVPWMQAHTYGGASGLQNVSPEQVDRMAAEQWHQGVDAIMWLGYGETFPKVRPDSWERATAFHRRLNEAPPPKPKAELAVLRFYDPWALESWNGGRMRNPGDWRLQQFLEVWSVEHGQPYDVFEIPPRLSAAEKAELQRSLRAYPHVAANAPWPGAWNAAEGPDAPADPAAAPALRAAFDRELRQKGWLP
jgi:hypothetical protein